jgi:uncharacterized RDD family membrane protein YckC
MPIQIEMNAIAHASALSTTGPQLDNRRVLAGLIDLVVVAAGAALILFAADALPSGSGSARDEVGSGLYLLATAWGLYYYFACESGGGQTLGKRLMRLRVVRADGSDAGMREVAVRTVLRVVDGIGLYLVGLVVMLVSGKRRQRLGDMAGGTIVVDASAGPATVEAAPAPAVAAAPIVPAGLGTPAVTLPPLEEPAALEAEPAPPAPADPLTPFEPILGENAALDTAPVVEEAPGPVVEEAPVPVAEEPPADEPVVVRSVETVSAIDLVMGDEDEQDEPEDGPLAPPAGR